MRYDLDGGYWSGYNGGISQYKKWADYLDKNVPGKKGYEFKYWSDGEGGIYAPGEFATFTKDTVLKAVYSEVVTEKRFTIQFEKGDPRAQGTPYKQYVGPTDDVLKKNQFTLEGYKFIGWKFPDGRVVADEAPIAGFKDSIAQGALITLVAQWSKYPYIVHFDLNGGKYNGSTTVPLKAGDSSFSVNPPKAVKPGFKLVGWSDGKNEYGTGQWTCPTGEWTLTAIWERMSFVVEFRSDMPNTTGTMADQTICALNVPLSANAFSVDGYAFDGWMFNGTVISDMGVITPEMFTPSKDGERIVLTAVWKELPNPYTLRFDLNGGSGDVADIAYGTSGVTIPKTDVTRPGYHFGGWELDGKTYKEGDHFDKDAKLSVLTAKWVRNQFTVSFQSGRDDSTGSMQDQLAVIGDRMDPNGFAVPGHTFVGWRLPNGAMIPDRGEIGHFVPTEGQRITVTAVWKEDKVSGDLVNSLAFDLNGGDGFAPTVWFGSSVTVPDHKVSRDGYQFGGWALGDRVYHAGDLFDTEGQSTLTAVWLGFDYWVEFDAGLPNHTGNMGMQHITGEDTILDANAYSVDGHTFLGWRAPNGAFIADRGEAGAIGARYAGELVVLTAVWKVDDTEGEKVNTLSFDLNGGTGDDSSISFGKGVNIPDRKIVREGYVFAGWECNGRTYHAHDLFTDTGDSTLTAKWVRMSYWIVFEPGAEGVTGRMNPQFVDGPGSLDANLFERNGYTFAGWSGFPGKETVADGHDLEDIVPETDGQVITLTAKWDEVKDRTLRFDPNGGTMGTESMEYGVTGALIPAESPTKKGYQFGGWALGDKVYKPGDRFNGDAKETTMKAVWTKLKFTVRFDPNGGSGEMADQVITGDGVKLNKNVFTKDRHRFAGWIYDGKEVSDMASMDWFLPEKDGQTITLTAKWENIQYSHVRFDLNGGTGSFGSMEFEDSTSLPTDKPTRKGYAFMGWELDGKTYQPGERFDLKGDNVLTAKWTKWTFKVVFESGISGSKGRMADQTITGDEKLNRNRFVRDGYTFVGWRMSNGLLLEDQASMGFHHPDGDGESVVLTGVWKKDSDAGDRTSMIVFDKNGGEGFAPDHVFAKSTNIPGYKVCKDGYVFGGWILGNRVYFAGDLFEVTGKSTLKAVWLPIDFWVEFKAGMAGSTGNMGMQHITPDGTVLDANLFSVDGYTFVGWRAPDGTLFPDAGDVSSLAVRYAGEVVTLKGVWERNAEAGETEDNTMRFDLNGGKGEAPDVRYGASVNIPELDISRHGYTFAGWELDGSTYHAKDLFDLQGDHTLTAKWVEWTFWVRFVSGMPGSTGAMNHLLVDRAGVPFPACGFVSEGRQFLSWAYVDGDTALTVLPGKSLDGFVPDHDGQVIEVTAVWGVVKDRTVTFDLNGGKGTMTSQRYGVDGTTIPLEKPTRAGYTFLGWAYGDRVYKPGDLFSGDKASCTLTAEWDKLTYVVGFDPNGGKGTMDNQTISDDGVRLNKNLFTKDGYRFAGWTYNGRTVSDMASMDWFAPEKEGQTITLTAKWTAIQYNHVRFDLNGGTGSFGTMEFEDSVRLPSGTPEKQGYRFVGWELGGKVYGAGDVFSKSGNSTLTAKWERSQFTVRFVGGDGSSGTMADQVIDRMGTVLKGNAFTREGYEMKGWTMADGTVLPDRADMDFHIPSGDSEVLMLTAIWEKSEHPTGPGSGSGEEDDPPLPPPTVHRGPSGKLAGTDLLIVSSVVAGLIGALVLVGAMAMARSRDGGDDEDGEE